MMDDTAKFLDFITNVGIPGGLLVAIVLVGVYLAIRVMPKLVETWAANARSAQTLAQTLPAIEQHLRAMASGNSETRRLLAKLSTQMETNNSKLDQIIKRTP